MRKKKKSKKKIKSIFFFLFFSFYPPSPPPLLKEHKQMGENPQDNHSSLLEMYSMDVPYFEDLRPRRTDSSLCPFSCPYFMEIRRQFYYLCAGKEGRYYYMITENHQIDYIYHDRKKNCFLIGWKVARYPPGSRKARMVMKNIISRMGYVFELMVIRNYQIPPPDIYYFILHFYNEFDFIFSYTLRRSYEDLYMEVGYKLMTIWDNHSTRSNLNNNHHLLCQDRTASLQEYEIQFVDHFERQRHFIPFPTSSTFLPSFEYHYPRPAGTMNVFLSDQGNP